MTTYRNIKAVQHQFKIHKAFSSHNTIEIKIEFKYSPCDALQISLTTHQPEKSTTVQYYTLEINKHQLVNNTQKQVTVCQNCYHSKSTRLKLNRSNDINALRELMKVATTESMAFRRELRLLR